jgi:hypothetical protein
MIRPTCDQLVTLSARLGTVQGLEQFASQIGQITGQLLLTSQLNRAELKELKQCLTMVGETICHLRNAAALHLQALEAEKNNGY